MKKKLKKIKEKKRKKKESWKKKKKVEKKNEKEKKRGRRITVDYCCNLQWFVCGETVNSPHVLVY